MNPDTTLTRNIGALIPSALSMLRLHARASIKTQTKQTYMNHQRILLAATATAAFLSFSHVSADERGTFQRRAATGADDVRSAARSFFTKQPRTKLRPFERVFLNNAVYRYEGRPGLRHDEVSSPEVIFHIDNGSGRIVAGHAWDQR